MEKKVFSDMIDVFKWCYYLRYSAVTTFHSQRQRQHGTEPALYLAIVIVDCDDDCRADYSGRAAKAIKETLIGFKFVAQHDPLMILAVFFIYRSDVHFYASTIVKRHLQGINQRARSKQRRKKYVEGKQ